MPRDLYRQLSHPIRRQIVSLLGSRGQMSATALMTELGLSPGNFYYHLGFIGPLIQRRKDGQYALSEAGKTAYAQVLSWDVVSSVTSLSGQFDNRFYRYVCLGKLASLKRAAIVASALAFALLELGAYAFSNVMPKGFFVEKMHSSGLADVLLGYCSGLVLFILMTSVLLRIMKKAVSLEWMATAYAFSQVPLAAFSAIVPVLGSRNVAVGVVNVVFLGFQVWAMMILASNLSRAARISLASAGLISLLLVYANLAILFFNLPFFLVF
ncbi:MAG: helix-turn-helix transcriptional regulator [Candidatus Brockarchaeota archaeon]|nr:helix-turn-helix transcriptional regulator [Candidatus Brockarchaeota archaeon]